VTTTSADVATTTVAGEGGMSEIIAGARPGIEREELG